MKLLNSLLFILLFFSNSFAIEQEKIKIATIKDMVPYSFINSDGKADGIFVDYWKLWSTKTGKEVEFIPYDWQDSLHEIKLKNIDIHSGLFKNEQRAEYIKYLKPIYPSQVNMYVTKSKNINSINEIENKSIGVLTGTYFETYLKNNFPSLKINNYRNFKEQVESIKDSKIDLFMEDSLVAWFHLINNLSFNNIKTISDFELNKWFYAGIRNNDIHLESLVNSGINAITEEDMIDIEKKWILQENLRFFEQNQNNKKVLFTPNEIEYIKKTSILKVGIEDWTAIMGSKDGKNLEGIGADIVSKAFELSGLKFEFIKGDWEVLLRDFKDKKIDILPTTLYTKQRAEYGEYSKKYLSVQNYIYVNSNNSQVKSMEDLIGKKLAIQKDFGTIPLIKEKYPNIDIIETKNLEESIQMVLNNDVDALFELQLSVESKMREFLITNLKAISQNTINPMGLHILSKKDDFILKSILNKSLDAIPSKDINNLINKWINAFDIKKDIKVAFALGREPYVLDKDFIKGIEYDLVNKILNLSSLNIKTSKNISVKQINSILEDDKSFDMAVNIDLKKDNNLYYSDPFLSFKNIVVSKKNKKFNIRNVRDLKGKKVMAFLNAHKYLGNDFKAEFVPNKTKNYIEEENQINQVKALLNNQVDFIVLDKSIFKWYFNKLSNESIDNYQFHHIFPNKNNRYVGFRDKNLRDIFNKNLKLFKESGSYDEVFSDYTEGYIDAKVKINSLISAIVANNIFSEQIDELDEIINIFSELPYIEKIEVFNNENELLSQSSEKKLKDYFKQNSYHYIVNVPTKVGYIKVYFDNNLLKFYEKSNDFIPRFQKFEDLRSYSFIKNVYKKFGYFTNKIDFTKKEREFLKHKKVITFSEISWEPLIIVDDDKFSGLFLDYLKLIQLDTGLEFKFIKSKNWDDVLDKFENGEIDIIPGLGDIAFSIKNSFVSNSMTDFKFAIVSHKDENYLDGIKSLKGKTLALPKNFSSYNLIKNRFPDIVIKETNSINEALDMVLKDEVDAFVGHSAIALNKIQNGYADLKIVGLSEERFNHYILIQDKYPELLSILNKAIFNITPKQKFDMKNKWIQSKNEIKIDYELIYKIVGIFTFILIIILIFTKKLSNAKKEVEITNKKMQETVTALTFIKEELTEKTKDLEEQKNAFETLFFDTSDGLSLIKDGKFVECNQAVLNMLKYKNKEEFLNLTPQQLSPKFQPDGQKSDEKAKKILENCIKVGSSNFEWVHLKSTGEKFWVDIVLTRIVLNHETVIHVVWRDIEDKKILEAQNQNRTIELEKANEELEVSINNLKETQNQLIESEKMASLGALVAGVAHEINTPIGIGLTGASHFKEISEKIQKLYKNNIMTQEDFEEYLKTSNELSILINSNLKRAADLVKSFKQVAVDQTSEERRNFNLLKYIEEILASIHSVTKKTNLNIIVDCDDNIEINSYPGAISQVITNLIMNSITHAYEPKQKGSLQIKISKIKNDIEIVYNDDGKGIKEEHLSKVFDPFFTTNREKGGSGLGLNIIYNIVTTKLNGTIKCKNNKKGVEFIITFKV